MNDLAKRLTVCKVMGHDWTKAPYPHEANGDGTGTFMKCLRCHKENHDYGTVPRGASPFFH